jgi:hypothetical protein
MTTETQNPPTGDKPKGRKPDYQLYAVSNDGDDAHWISLTGLWPTKNGHGWTGVLPDHISIVPGTRLVISPVDAS